MTENPEELDSDILDLEETEEDLSDVSIQGMIKELYADYRKKKKKYPEGYPLPKAQARKKKYPETGYPYPKKMQEFIDEPEKWPEFEKTVLENEQKVKDYEAKISELSKKLGDFETNEKNLKVTELLNLQESKGLIAPEMKETLAKDYSTKFSIEQIDTMIKNFSTINFSRQTLKSGEPEPKTKDFEKKKDLDERIKFLDEQGIKGEYYDELVKEFKDLA